MNLLISASIIAQCFASVQYAYKPDRKPQSTTDTNCAGVYGAGDENWLGCQDQDATTSEYFISDVQLEEVIGKCSSDQNNNKLNNYKQNGGSTLTQKVILRVSISPMDYTTTSTIADVFDVGIFLSGNDFADSDSPNNCQHYFLSPITPDLQMQNSVSGFGPFYSFSDQCGDIDMSEPEIEILVKANLICSKKHQKTFDINACLSWNEGGVTRNCAGLRDAIPFFDGTDWTPCSCNSFVIELDDGDSFSSSYGYGYSRPGSNYNPQRHYSSQNNHQGSYKYNNNQHGDSMRGHDYTNIDYYHQSNYYDDYKKQTNSPNFHFGYRPVSYARYGTGHRGNYAYGFMNY